MGFDDMAVVVGSKAVLIFQDLPAFLMLLLLLVLVNVGKVE